MKKHAIIPIFIPHQGCPSDCVFCNQKTITARQPDVTDDFTYDTAKIEAFLLPKGTGVELYATTLHYAPCNADKNGFRVVIVLPKDTNLPLGEKHEGGEDGHLTAKNKWLIGHPEGGLPEGSPLGLIGENISLK